MQVSKWIRIFLAIIGSILFLDGLVLICLNKINVGTVIPLILGAFLCLYSLFYYHLERFFFYHYRLHTLWRFGWLCFWIWLIGLGYFFSFIRTTGYFSFYCFSNLHLFTTTTPFSCGLNATGCLTRRTYCKFN